MQRYWHTHRHVSLTCVVETNFLKYFGHLSIDKAGSPNKVELKLDQWIYFNCSSDLEPDLSACLQTSGRRASPPSTFTLWLAVDARNHLVCILIKIRARKMPLAFLGQIALLFSYGKVKSGLEENWSEHDFPFTRTSNVVFLLQVLPIDLCFSSC